MSCAYCADGADHEAVDHRDPARAAAVAERYEIAGDPRFSLWREVARRQPKRRTTPTRLTVELVAVWLKSPIERYLLRGFADVAAARAIPFHLGWGFYGPPSQREGLQVTCQESHGRYTLDFVLRAGHKPLVVESDGHEFHQKTKAQVAHDRARDRYFVERGFIVIRYTGSEIRRNARLCAEQAIAIAMGELIR